MSEQLIEAIDQHIDLHTNCRDHYCAVAGTAIHKVADLEAEKALAERRFRPFLKRLIEATKPYHENEDAPEAAETLFNIYEDAVMIRAALVARPKGEKERDEHTD